MSFMETIKTKLNIFAGDVFGGINSAIITLPQALAFGVATGFGAGAGLWGAIILCFVAGILGTKTPLISGTTGPVAIVVASMMLALRNDIGAAVTIMLIAAVLQLIASLTNLPSMVKYVPYPVISGFMNGVGVIIIILQLNPLMGHPAMSSTVTTVMSIHKSLASLNHDAVFIGIITLIVAFFTPKIINRFVPSQVLALIIGTIISIKLGLHLDRISELSVSFPSIIKPDTDIHHIITYLPYAFTLAVVFSAESMLTGLVSDSLTKTRHSPKRLLAAQGIGNFMCALTGSLGGSAATMRSVAALNAGASTKMCAVINPVLLIILLFKCSGFVAQIPLAVLAAILMKIGYDIIDVKLLKVLKYAPKDDLYVLFLVFLLTVFYNLIFAVGAGITLAALLYAKRVADKAELVHKSVYDTEIMELERILERDYKHKIRVVHISGQFFFGSATQLISKFDELLGTEILILNYESDDLLDISAIFALEDIILRLQSQNIAIILVIKNEKVLAQLKDHCIVSQIGEKSVFYTEMMAIEHAKEQLKFC
ncbi:MAG: SulP family inorganic anion transporter [Clostridium sp.]|nr:SulP family inorganic anion transporter [Clostridium sp.]